MITTIYDVAREAGVSIATVSKVINKNGRISEKTRKKVSKVMEQLNYQPSMVASALTGKRTGTIGLLVPDIANPYFAEVARSFEDWAQKKGFGVVMCSTDSNKEKTSYYLSLLRRQRVDGFIIASHVENIPIVKQLLQENIPIVLFSTDLSELAVSTVSVDDYRGGFQAASYLLSQGHRYIGMIAEERSKSTIYRLQGYKEAMQAVGADFKEEHIIFTEGNVEHGRMAAKQLLAGGQKRPTAIIAHNDMLAIGAMSQAQALGISVPEDLSIVGFDNTILAEFSNPTLTSVSQPIRDMTYTAINMLIEQMENHSAPKQRVLMLPQLIIRHSTAPIPS